MSVAGATVRDRAAGRVGRTKSVNYYVYTIISIPTPNELLTMATVLPIVRVRRPRYLVKLVDERRLRRAVGVDKLLDRELRRNPSPLTTIGAATERGVGFLVPQRYKARRGTSRSAPNANSTFARPHSSTRHRHRVMTPTDL